MPGEGRTASTKNAKVTEKQPSSDRTGSTGTGQHSTTATNSGAKISRDDDRPSKSSGKIPEFGTVRRGEGSTMDDGLKPPAVELAARMVKDSGPKTSRERDFAAQMKDRRTALTSPNSDRQFYPDALEDEKNEFTKGDGYSGTKAAFRPKKAQ
jgi:hypothetical protein